MTPLGTTDARPVITLSASGTLIDPVLSDGVRSMAFAGSVGSGEALVFDAPQGRVTLVGVDVTPYTTGEFPRLSPEGSTLTYTDAVGSSHTAAATVRFRSRWW